MTDKFQFNSIIFWLNFIIFSWNLRYYCKSTTSKEPITRNYGRDWAQGAKASYHWAAHHFAKLASSCQLDQYDFNPHSADPWLHRFFFHRIASKNSTMGCDILFLDWVGNHSWLSSSVVPSMLWGVSWHYSYPYTGLSPWGFGLTWIRNLPYRSLPLRIFLACVGGGAVQGSIRWWSSKHRAHHRWTDTFKDPYSVRKGVWYSHFMWMVLKQNPKDRGRTDISDLNHDPIVVLQHRYYGMVILAFGILFPMLVAGLGWGDWKGGLVYAGILRFFFVQQATFCVNSLAHWLGDQVRC